LSEHLARFPFAACPGLRNPHAQTLLGPLLRPRPNLKWQHVGLRTPDDDHLHISWLPGQPHRPTVLLLHGLEGSWESHYIGPVARRFVGQGWTVVAPTYRGCSRQLNRAPRLYHSNAWEDLHLVTDWLKRMGWPNRIYGIGFSLGGNLAARWMAELGDDNPLAGAALVGSPMDLAASADRIDAIFKGRYSRYFLKSLIPKAVEKATQYPGLIDLAPIHERRITTLRSFDDCVTAPMHGFLDANDYYTRSSAGPVLSQVCRPTLVLAAKDDPFHPIDSWPEGVLKSNPWLIPLQTEQGGHLGFIGGKGPWRPKFWLDRILLRFFRKLEALLSRPEAPPAHSNGQH